MDYREAKQYVLSLTDYEKTPGILYTSTTYNLQRMEVLLSRVGNPHMAVKSVHIAGTKGKGSTAAMMASVLTQSAYRTGLYTSPHLHTLRERIGVDGTLISEEAFSRIMDRLRLEVEALQRESPHEELTTFEVMTAAALTYFAEREVQYAILEVGLGGRLDATNIVNPEVSVVTSISIDHGEVLGYSLDEVAMEKAGIIKRGSPVVSARQSTVVDTVIERVCAAMDAPLIRVGREVSWQMGEWSSGGQRFCFGGRKGEYKLKIPLLGEYQVENAACALAALEVLTERGAIISNSSISRGMSGVSWPGRLQILKKKPLVVCDGAHNADSAAKLRDAIKRYFLFDASVLVFGTSLDKDIGGMISELIPLFEKVIVTKSHHPRAASTDVLAEEFAQYDIGVEKAGSLPDAMSKAMPIVGRSGLVCVTGSLFVVAEALRWAGLGANETA